MAGLYVPPNEQRLIAAEATLTTLTKAVVGLYGAVLEVASLTEEPSLREKLNERIEEIAPLLEQAVQQITGNDGV